MSSRRIWLAQRFCMAMQLPAFEFLPQVNDSVETALFKNEIEYYKGFFREVYVMEGFSSGKTVSHPLLSKANALYRKTRYCKSRGDAVMELLQDTSGKASRLYR